MDFTYCAQHQFRHKVALRLCDRKILRCAEEKVMLLYTRNFYPEIDPEPEKAIVQQLRAAILSTDEDIEPRVGVLIALAHHAGLLTGPLSLAELKQHENRIKRIASGDAAGQASAQLLANVTGAMMMIMMIN